MKSKVKRKKIFCLENNVSFHLKSVILPMQLLVNWTGGCCYHLCHHHKMKHPKEPVLYIPLHCFLSSVDLFSHLFIRLASACLTKKTVCLSDKQKIKMKSSSFACQKPISFLVNFQFRLWNPTFQFKLWNTAFQFVFFRFGKH